MFLGIEFSLRQHTTSLSIPRFLCNLQDSLVKRILIKSARQVTDRSQIAVWRRDMWSVLCQAVSVFFFFEKKKKSAWQGCTQQPSTADLLSHEPHSSLVNCLYLHGGSFTRGFYARRQGLHFVTTSHRSIKRSRWKDEMCLRVSTVCPLGLEAADLQSDLISSTRSTFFFMESSLFSFQKEKRPLEIPWKDRWLQSKSHFKEILVSRHLQMTRDLLLMPQW